ncbi:MAG: Sec-dependent nitrous-oxide reductase [Gemmatimonadales bacterium]|nr:MAG: Sec-dependent nitrous-oxide reductase [Gemmatimonadales bacterium]
MTNSRIRLVMIMAAVAFAGAFTFACQTSDGPAAGFGDAASEVYVAPGEYDEFYAFMSGGFSGNVTVHGLPSGRLIKTIAVFSQFPENGCGYSEETKDMLKTSFGMIPWDDAHHPQLSQTAGVPDGRWLFINGNNTPRIARIDLSKFETEEIIEIPNSGGNHASPFITPNSEYVIASTRFSVPIPQADVSISTFKENFSGTLTFIRADQPGEMDIAFQIHVPGYNYDIAHSGREVSDGWAFFTTYNTEQEHTLLEVNASQADKDFVAAVNWRRAEACAAENAGRIVPGDYIHNVMGEDRIAHSEMKNSVRMIEPADCSDMIYFLPTPKSPHGVDVDPTGEYIVAGGKLATTIAVHSFSKMIDAIANQRFETVIDGIPVLEYEAVLAGEVQEPGLGPLHTEFDGRGNAYTSMFISSEIVKWKLGTWEVLDRQEAFYSTGHVMIPGGDSSHPWGKYVIALNKITKDRYLPTGPELAHAAQLIDISGDNMRLLLDFPTMGEPHYAQALPADLITPNQVRMFDLNENTNPYATIRESDARVERDGRTVHVYMTTIRSHFVPDNVEGVMVGDTVFFHVTNVEQDWDVPHGFAMIGARNSELLVMPGETRTLRWVPQRVGVFPFYCTDFCSALHQEMQGYVRVSERGSNPTIAFGTGG